MSYPKSYFRRRYRALAEEKRARKEETYEERKALAFAKGTRVDFMVCPLCGMNRPIRRRRGPPVFISDPEFFIQARYTFGRESGYFTNEDESLKLGDPKLMETPQGRRMVEDLCRNVRRLYYNLRKLYPEQMGVRRRVGEKK